ncbi:hypothetical protein V2J09_000801 [Rumex salicifolius]
MTSRKTTRPPTSKFQKKTSMAAVIFFFLLTVLALFAFVAPLPSLDSLSHRRKKIDVRAFDIDDDLFWKDGKPFQIIGGDLHYFRILPQYWEDRLLRAKALGLNTIQTYVPWNLHEPHPGKLVFEGVADIILFLRLCNKLDLLVMLRAGPYICGEWDLGGFPAWLLSKEPPLRLRSSDPAYLRLVDKWWEVLLPMIAPFLYVNGGPIVMLQIENEYGSFGDDKAYLHHLVRVARRHLGNSIILYTTDGGSRENLEKGTIRGDSIYSAVDYTTGDNPWPIFKLQKEFNAPGKSPPLTSEFYTGWLTHWGEKNAKTDASFTASELEKILSRNVSAVLYMAHGGTNFGFYNGANSGSSESDYKPDLTSYDYDAPIKECGDVDNPKFVALREVIARCSKTSLPPVPPNVKKTAYGYIQLQKTGFLLDAIDIENDSHAIESTSPIAMEYVGQMYGFLLYISEYAGKDNTSILFIPEVHDRAQVFISCPSKENEQRPIFAGVTTRWSTNEVHLPYLRCASNTSLFILVENMGRINYGPYIFDKKGILSHVFLDKQMLYNWKMKPVIFGNLNAEPQIRHIFELSIPKDPNVTEPAFFMGQFVIKEASQVKDTFLSLDGWGKGLAFVNNFNLGRYWPSRGPQCNLYVPAPVLRQGVLFELESPNSELVLNSVQQPDFACGQGRVKI